MSLPIERSTPEPRIISHPAISPLAAQMLELRHISASEVAETVAKGRLAPVEGTDRAILSYRDIWLGMKRSADGWMIVTGLRADDLRS